MKKDFVQLLANIMPVIVNVDNSKYMCIHLASKSAWIKRLKAIFPMHILVTLQPHFQ